MDSSPQDRLRFSSSTRWPDSRPLELSGQVRLLCPRPPQMLQRIVRGGALLAYLHEQTPRPLLCEALPRTAEVEVVSLPRAAGRLRWRQDTVEEGVQHRLQLPVQQLSPE